jgi:RNA polymerase sigma-70 factor (ECF subfamily)
MWRLGRKAAAPNLERASALEHASEHELIGLARNASGAAIQEIMRRHNRRLFRTARSILGSDWEAEEVVQDGYVKAFRALNTFREEAQLGTWLTRIVIHEAQGRLRGRREHLPLSELDDKTMGEIIQFPGGVGTVIDPERQTALTEIRTLLEEAIDALPKPFREVFVLRQVEGLSVEETAQVLSLAPETVKTRLYRARARLQRRLQDQLAPALKDTFPFEGERCRRLTGAVLRRLAQRGPS